MASWARRNWIGVSAAAACALVMVVGGLRWMTPFLTQDRAVIADSPSLGGLFSASEATIPGGATACVAPVRFDDHTRIARLRVTTTKEPVPRLEVYADGTGYRSTRTVGRLEAGAQQVISVPITPPPKPIEGRMCVHNTGRQAVELVGTGEARSIVAAETTVDGKVAEIDAELTFFDDRPSSLVSRTGTIVDHAASLTGGLVPAWLLWPLLVLAALGIPAGVLGALLVSRD